MSYKDFDSWLAEQRGEVTFTVGGQTYTGRKRVPWQKMNKYLMSLGEDTDGIESTKDFFRMVLVPADRERFVAAIDYDGDDDEQILASEQVGKILDWLLGIYTGKGEKDKPVSTDSQPSNVVSLNPKAS
ncbi:MAG TPA: hypothetical protein VE326_11480 [Candidatus Binatia bacterium]|nr:hypothetical protein [Candidatus Binatia bacterium]